MNQREKEEYLREYAILKAKGKPFFPYAVVKDAAMACVVMAVIITMSLVLGAALGSKGDPTKTPEAPRPIATGTSIEVIGAMAFLTYSGANAGSPTAIELKTPQAVLSAGGKLL